MFVTFGKLFIILLSRKKSQAERWANVKLVKNGDNVTVLYSYQTCLFFHNLFVLSRNTKLLPQSCNDYSVKKGTSQCLHKIYQQSRKCQTQKFTVLLLIYYAGFCKITPSLKFGVNQ